jgi:hypothetical protein
MGNAPRKSQVVEALAFSCSAILFACTSATSVSSGGGDARVSEDAPSSRIDGGGGKPKPDASATRKPDASPPPPTDGSVVPGPDAVAGAPGNTGGGLGARGVVATSPHYKFIGTLGQTPSGNSVSAAGRLNGGVVAATQHQP